MNPQLKEKIMESLAAVLPISGIVLALSVFLVPLDVGTVMIFLFGAVMLILGMGMFQLGAEMAMEPLGDGIGVQMSKTKWVWLIASLSFAMGLIITIAEPDLAVLANQVPNIQNATLILTVAIGVGIFLALAVLRILLKINLSWLLMGLYAAVILFSCFVPKSFLAVAYDSGGVTTGPITVPFIMALGVGLSSIRTDKDSSSDSFGLVALSSVGPILAVMILGICFNADDVTPTLTSVPVVDTMRDVSIQFAHGLPHYFKEVIISLVPILAVFILFQAISNRYHHREVFRVSFGFIYTYLGLVLFLCGVNVGFAPVGAMLGKEMAFANKWLLIPIGMLVGYFIVKAEPAIQILNKQVESVTSGTVSAKAMNRCLQIGVAVSLGLSMARIVMEIPIQYIVIPGYVIALVMSRFVPKIFVGIAFDSGGVASGPMTSTFLLPLCIGACTALGGNVMTDAFGAVALVALTPLIAVQIMGITYKIRLARKAKNLAVLPLDSGDIIVTEEW